MQKLDINSMRLQIRNLREPDLAGFHLYRSDPEVARYQGYDVMNRQQCAEFINLQRDKEFGKPGDWVQYAIEEKLRGIVIGDCAIKLGMDDARIAEIGITIAPTEQRKGYAKECLQAILAFLFDTQNVLRIVETVDAENLASVRLLESVGFKKEGHFIENIFFKGKWGSEFQYAMLKREWDVRHLTT
jgi:RimJ/RimL family protein N-acetyltransferase